MYDPQAIILLGGALINDQGAWRTARFEDIGDNYGMTGDSLRVVATTLLACKFPQSALIVSGGLGQYKEIPGAPTIASVNATELVAATIAYERIILEQEGNNTWQQLQRIKDIIKNKNITTLVIVTNRWHVPRVSALIEKDQFLWNLSTQGALKCLSAEEVVLEKEPDKWESLIAAAYQDARMLARIEQEQKGITSIRNGTYHF